MLFMLDWHGMSLLCDDLVWGLHLPLWEGGEGALKGCESVCGESEWLSCTLTHPPF